MLTTIIGLDKEAVELDNKVQQELENIDSEIIRRQKELESLIKERDIVTRRAV